MTSQKEGMTLEQYLDEFLNYRKIVEQRGGNATYYPGLVNTASKRCGFDLDDPASIGAEERVEAERDVKEAYLAYVFLSNANIIKFAPLLGELANSHLHGNDEYPHTITAGHKLLVGWEGGLYVLPGPSSNGIAYTPLGEDPIDEELGQEGNLSINTGNDGGKVLRSKCGNIIKCYLCCGNHYSNTCDQKKENGNGNGKKEDFGDWGLATLGGFIFSQHGEPMNRLYKQAPLQPAKKTLILSAPPSKWSATTSHLLQQSGIKEKIDPNWVLLDSQSTVNVFCNTDLLVNICHAKYSLHIYCTAGRSTTDMIKALLGSGAVWLYPDCIANILSLAKVAEMFPVTYDSTDSQGFLVHKPDRTVRMLRKSENGFFYFAVNVQETVLVNIVEVNKNKYNPHDYSCTFLAQKIQAQISYPSLKTYLHIVDNNLLPNCPITQTDIMAAEDIWGPYVGCLQEKPSAGLRHM
eukprot:8974263-Ditylum_brightwellii.AAC.1